MNEIPVGINLQIQRENYLYILFRFYNISVLQNTLQKVRSDRPVLWTIDNYIFLTWLIL